MTAARVMPPRRAVNVLRDLTVGVVSGWHTSSYTSNVVVVVVGGNEGT